MTMPSLIKYLGHPPTCILSVNLTSPLFGLSSATFHSPLKTKFFKLFFILILLLCHHSITMSPITTLAQRCLLGLTSPDSNLAIAHLIWYFTRE